MLTLNTTAHVVQGVALSKDQSGVTAIVPLINITVLFDGNAAHVKGTVETEKK